MDSSGLAEASTLTHAHFSSAIAMGTLASLAVILRVIFKSHRAVGITADDVFIIFALCMFWTYIGILFWAIFVGGGGLELSNLINFDLNGVSTYLKGVFFLTPIYTGSVIMVKLSLLSFYYQVFSIQQFRRVVVGLGVYCVLLFTSAELALFLSCIPLKVVWSFDTPGKCINFDALILSTSIIDIIADIVIVCLPIWVIRGLQLNKRDKVALVMIFALAGFVIITGIIRLRYTYNSENNNTGYLKGILWSNIHLGTAIVCACLPALRPLFTHVASFFTSLSSLLSSISHYRKHSTKGSGAPDTPEDSARLTSQSPSTSYFGEKPSAPPPQSTATSTTSRWGLPRIPKVTDTQTTKSSQRTKGNGTLLTNGTLSTIYGMYNSHSRDEEMGEEGQHTYTRGL
ncbi:MAG: hypothetical protein MMC33_008285 [Icmadophila ericetorum]|nr:hypothetical protein [Icmadophila ericetorum]